MTRNLIAFEDRLSLLFQCRQASANPQLSPQSRQQLRLAVRYLRGDLNSASYDVLARLQILEGVSGVVSLKPMMAGPWSKSPRQGLAAAREHFQGTTIDPEWLSPQNTGLITMIRNMVKQVVSQRSRGRELHFDADDILQNGLMGLAKDGTEQLPKGPLLIQFGHLNTGVKQAILGGRVVPRDVAGIVGKFFAQKVTDQFQYGDKARAPDLDAEGRDTLDQQTYSEAETLDVLADALANPHSPVRELILRELQHRLGDGRWAEVGMAFLTAQANGEEVNKGAMAAQYDMAGGTFSKLLREKVYPALEAVRNDTKVQEALADFAERMQRRAALSAAKKDFKLKNGDVIPKGTPAQFRFLGERHPDGSRIFLIAFSWIGPSGRDYMQDPVKMSFERAHMFVSGIAKPPGIAALERMSDNAVATTPTGKRVEPDGWGPDGTPSWLLILGYI